MNQRHLQLLTNLQHHVPAFWLQFILKWEKKTSSHVEMYVFILQKPPKKEMR